SRSAMNWLVVSAPTKAWARKIFEGASDDVLVPALWDAIFATCRINASDPVAAWEAHLAGLAARHAYLNDRRYTALRLAGPGTDLTIGLPEGHIWMGGKVTSGNGITFTPNLPTEEVFSMPQRDRVDGTVASTKPLNLGGSLIENFSLTFKDGAVVDVQAEKGEEHLRKLLDTDDGARRLGEIALVPHSSPISASGLLFYNTLYDENASCHVALGRAYRMTMENGGAMDDDAFAAAGGNNSLIHVDFMIGSGELDIDGIMASGEAEPVMRGGEWAFEV
ncbi:MAG: aminopeptidase, partial [Anaerolineae bacterium]|nr:aminopeptidase [Anaerolineae bacterium]